jgi:menaquinone-9 beta-reductase
MSFDAIVVGGSIAGCATTTALAQKNLRVLLLEKASLGRDKACGEGLLPAGVASLTRLGALHLATQINAQPFYGAGFELEGQIARADFPEGHALGVRRQKLDEAFFRYAATLPGVTARERCTVQGLLFAPNGYIAGVALPNGERVYADIVIGADGLASPLRTAVGFDGGLPKHRRYGMRVHLGLPNAKPFGDYVHVLLDHPGEFYFTPVGPNELQVAYLGEPSVRGLSKKNYVQTVLTHPRLRDLFEGAEVTSEVMGAGPFGRKARAIVTDGFALVGDAAGYVDAVTGEGMELALRSSEALAATVFSALQGDGPSKKNLLPYALARHQIVQDPDRLTRLVLLLERFPALARRGIRALKGKPQLFQKLLAVQGGEAKLSSLSLRDWLGLLGL